MAKVFAGSKKFFRQDGLGQPIKIWDVMRDGTVPDFDSLSGQSRKGHYKTGKGRSKTEKDILKQEI